jgi:hypothetical protein
LNDPTPLIFLSFLVMFFALRRVGKTIQMPRVLAFFLVAVLLLFINFAYFILKVHAETALVLFLTVLVLSKSLILCKVHDYAQLMFLSVLSMLAAGAYQPSTNFPLYAFVYTVLAGYTVFKFHLLTEVLSHRRVMDSLPTLVISSPRQGGFVSFLATAIITCSLALVIFSFIPRQGPNWSFGAQFGSLPGSSTGYSQEMVLGKMAETLQDKSSVLRVKSVQDMKQKKYNRTLYLRGMTLSQYVQMGNQWKWIETRSSQAMNKIGPMAPLSNSVPIQEPLLPLSRQTLWRISFEQSVPSNLFVIDRPVQIAANRPVSLNYDPAANTISVGSSFQSKGFVYELKTEDALNVTRYDVTAQKAPTVSPPSSSDNPEMGMPPVKDQVASSRVALKTEEAPNLSRYDVKSQKVPIASQPLNTHGHRTHGPSDKDPFPSSRAAAGFGRNPLFDSPEPAKPVDIKPFKPLAKKILESLSASAGPEEKVQKIENWLKSHFQYTLDNTDVDRTKEPLMDFLTRRKHGHCEYFASALAILARTLDLDAQVVIGFKDGMYNSLGDYYLVRQCDAHAWVEVYSPGKGWISYDPTPAARDEFIRDQDGAAFKWFWDLVDLMQYSWADKLANLASNDKKEILENLQKRIIGLENEEEESKWSLTRIIKNLINLIKGQDYESVWLQVLHSIVAILVFVLIVLLSRIVYVVAGIAWGSLHQSFHRRWEKRFGSLWFCPVDFYRRTLLWLATRGMTRGGTETAWEFAHRIGETYPAISPQFRFLTETYLAVRFGNLRLTSQQKDDLNLANSHIQLALSEKEK